MKRRTLLIAALLVTIGIAIGLGISINLGVQNPIFAEQNTVSQETVNFLDRLSNSLSEVAEAVKPSVVNISTTKTVIIKDHPLRGFFNDPFFRRFFGEDTPFGFQREFKSSALGSGVIVTADGYILTNSHVIKDADEINIKLYNGKEYKGKVTGTDPKSDIAVIKIDAENLPALKIGESDSMKTGDVVIAVGNPFGLNQTITMGIVSATGRSNVGIADYEDFIQIDAAINPGNSGGALVNSKGELIGINTAIFSTSGGNMGIGFAIPSDMAKTIMQSVIKHGKVIRGWLGVSIQNLTPELAKNLDIKAKEGALITDVVENSPAEKTGLKRGDLIIEIEGKKIKDSASLRNTIASTSPETTLKMTVIREGKEKILTVSLGEFPENITAQLGEHNNILKGVYIQEITPELREGLAIPDKVKGVIVTNVDEDSPAINVLKKNDVIQEINKKDIQSLQDYNKMLSKIEPDNSILLLVYRGGGYLYITLKP